jgi:hypothetical protein
MELINNYDAGQLKKKYVIASLEIDMVIFNYGIIMG